VFMPVKKVNYSVQESKVPYKESLQDSLTFEIWTNGSLSPQEAITNSAHILTNLFSPLKHLNLKVPAHEDTQEEKKISQVLIEELHLSVRAYNCLKRAQIHSVANYFLQVRLLYYRFLHQVRRFTDRFRLFSDALQ